MKRGLLLVAAIAAIFVAGCDSSTPPSEKGGAGGAGGRSAAPTDIKVASDGVVRDAAGKAYCVVMHQPVVGDEKEYPFAEKDGVKYIFCCKSCPGMFQKDPSKYTIAKN